MKKIALTVAAAALLSATAAGAQTYPPPQLPYMGNSDLFQDYPNGSVSAQDYFVNLPTLAGSIGSAGQSANYLIGGDAGTNLWQRATTGASETTTYAYGGPDRWAYWSGTNTAVTVSRDSTAAALPTGTQYDFKMQRTAAQTGVVQTCMAQEIETSQAIYLAGHTVEVDLNTYAGANFSATAYNVYVIYGTGTDEGMQKMAWGLNAGGGGSTAWAGQANATAGLMSGLAVSTAYKHVAVASIPTTATEVGVAICFTPVGTAGTTDALYFSNIELRKADGLAGFASSTVGYAVSTTTNSFTAAVNGTTQNAVIAPFDKRPVALESLYQYRYFWQINEPAASKAVGNGNYQTSTICDVQIPTPVPMRAAPTLTIGGTSESNATWAIMIASTTPVVLATTYLIQDAVIGNTPNMIAVQATTAGKTAGQGCTLVGAGGGANIQASAEL